KTWQYSTNNGQSWEDLAAFETVGFLIPCDIELRALYVNPVTTPTIELASSHYDDKAEYQGQTYTMGNIMYQMDYKLPDGYKLLDAGIRLGDNAGISYYFEQTQRYSLDAESKGIAAGIGAGLAALAVVGNVFLDGSFGAFGFAKDYGQAMFNKPEEVVYLEREENVMVQEKMAPATLAKKMYESIPINVKKYDPIYWEAKAPTKGLFGSICTTPPLHFAQKNNQDHYIYGIAYMRYETPDKQMKTLYTDAIAATVNNPSQHTSKMEQAPSARQTGSGFSSDETAAAARKAPKREPEQQEAETLDMSTVTAPQTQLVVYVDGDYSAALSDAYGYNEKVTVTAPTVQGKTFSYWQADGGTVVTTDADLTLTMKANTTLRAVYGAATVPAASAVGITSATRTADGQSIVLQAIANGTFDTAGFVYSTTVAVPEINTDGVTRVGAVSYSNLSLIDQQPASILDRNNCFSLNITPDDEATVYHVRAYTYKGSDVSYSEVRDVKLSSLRSGIMMVANLEAFETDAEPGIDSLLTQLRVQGRLVAGYPITIAAG
ncbi:MAG: InlB B-repeat-containing protein, partial [Prevotella sp.]